MFKKNTIVVTGGSGRFAKSLKKTKCAYNFIYPTKKKLDITNLNSILHFLTSKSFPVSIFANGFEKIVGFL